eukprot:7990832-Alexandrium_andersonii.AAC.1
MLAIGQRRTSSQHVSVALQHRLGRSAGPQLRVDGGRRTDSRSPQAGASTTTKTGQRFNLL